MQQTRQCLTLVAICSHFTFYFHPAKAFQAAPWKTSENRGVSLVSKPTHLPAEMSLSEDKTLQISRNTQGLRKTNNMKKIFLNNMKSNFLSYSFRVYVNVSSMHISTSSQVLDYEQDLMKWNYNVNPQNSFLKRQVVVFAQLLQWWQRATSNTAKRCVQESSPQNLSNALFLYQISSCFHNFVGFWSISGHF